MTADGCNLIWQGYEQTGQLGGHFFTVARASDGEPRYIRELEIAPQTDGEALENQLQRMAKLHHANLAVPIDWQWRHARLVLVYSQVAAQPLDVCLCDGISVRSLMGVLRDVVQGLEHLHSQGFTYGKFDAPSIWRTSEGEGVLFIPNIDLVVASDEAAPFVEDASGRRCAGLPARSPHQDMEQLALFMISILRGSSAFSLPPGPTESDIVRLLHDTDGPLVPVFLPLLSGSWNLRRMEKFRDAISILEGREDWLERHVHTGPVSRDEVSLALAGAPELDRPGKSRRAGRRVRSHGGVGFGIGGALVALLILLASATALVYMSPTAQEALVIGLREVGVLPEPFGEGEDALLAQGADSSSGLAVRVGAYRSLLAGMPGHPQAMAELRQLLTNTREEIEVALAEGRLDIAGRRLGEARNLFPQDAELQRQREELSERRLAQNLFENTLALVQEGISSDEEGLTAIQAYREVVRLWPEHESANNALVAMARHFADKARTSMQGDEVAIAMRYLDYATNADADDPQVESVREQIQSAQTMRQEVETLLESASDYLASGALVDPLGANAAERYGRVLATDPDNSIALQGLLQVTSGVIEQIGSATAEARYGEARRILTRANQTALDETALNSVSEALDAAEQRAERLEILLRDAETLLADGFITAPAEQNLMAKLFEVQTLDADNPRAAELRQSAASRLAEVAEEAWNAGLREEAREYLGLALTLSPDRQEWLAKRDSWSLPSG